MNTDEIVRAARGLCARSLTGLNKYHGYIATKSSKHGEGVYDAIIERLYRHEHGIVPELCDLIESLQAQLADYHHMSELVDGKMEENQRLRRINENLQERLAAERDKYAELQRYNVDCTKACDRQMVEILELREQSANLAESQRRERAAVEDLETAESCITCEHDWDCEYSNSNGCSIANINGAARRKPGKERYDNRIQSGTSNRLS